MGAGFGIDILSNAIAGKPVIPNAPVVNLGQDQLTAISDNQTALGQTEQLAGGVNAFNQQQLQQMLQAVIPGYNAITSSASGNIEDLLAGKIPTDVQNTIESSDAAKALAGGFSGSDIGNTLTARDLGLTSLDLTQKGLDSATRWLTSMNSIANPGQFNLGSMFVTPAQAVAVDSQNQQDAFQRNYVSNMNDWQHSFGYAASQDLQDTIGTVISIAGSLIGGGLGGVGKGGGSSGSGAPSVGYAESNQDS